MMTLGELISHLWSWCNNAIIWILDFFIKIVSFQISDITVIQALVIPITTYFIGNYFYGLIQVIFGWVKEKLRKKDDESVRQQTLKLDQTETSLISYIHDNDTPSHRKAYSDRTAWLMACFSELSYEPLGNLDPKRVKVNLEKKLKVLLERELIKNEKEAVNDLIISVGKGEFWAQNRERLTDELNKYDMKIEHTYDYEDTDVDTQAFIVSSKNEFLVLVFRGTEANSFKDIRTDMGINLTPCPSKKGRVHSKFKKAFELAYENIQKDLDGNNDFKELPLFITGHSLGGALATIAAKRLTHKGGIAACYTFGSPRVGDEEWSYDIKTPVYRVVNAIDCVTMVPPSGEFIYMAKSFLGLDAIPYVGRILKWLLSLIDGYYHVGDERFLTNCKPNQYDDVQLTYKVSIFRRLNIFFRSKRPIGFVTDHKISIYRKKLALIAFRRNLVT